MTLRNKAAVLAVAGAAVLSAPVAAGAASANNVGRAVSHATAAPATSFTKIPVTGTAKSGKAFTGDVTVTQFVTHGGSTYAMGTLTGKLGNSAIKATQVAMPAAVKQASTSGMTSSSRSNATTPAGCPVLNLVLGPLHLNLLGLQVDLNQVVLNITAVPGAGNLLGNLLCGVANLLNTTPVTGATLTGLLNIAEQLANTPALSSL